MLDNWLSPLNFNGNDRLLDYSKEQFGRNIAVYLNKFPDLKKTNIALIGVSEKDANKVRSALYALDYPFNSIRIADLGNIRNEDTSFIIPVINELLQSDIIPIIIGRNPGSSFAQFKAYNNLKRSTNLVCVDERIRYNFSAPDSESDYLNAIFSIKNLSLFNLGVIGFQSHYTSEALLSMMDEKNFDYVRLGKIKASMEEVEPLIRDADTFSFNISALKYAEAPAVNAPTPSGLLSEEACKLTRYAGISDKLTSIGFYGFEEEKDQHNQTAQVIAQMIWYFVDGYYNRMNDFPASMNGLIEYIVEYKHTDQPVTFWKSSKSGRWWMQVPFKTSSKHQRHKLIPCSYQDYQKACRDSFPDRLINAYKRFS